MEDILLPESITRESPSCKDGLAWKDEKLHRIFGCGLISEAKTSLNLSQSIISTAQNLLHRFFYRKSLFKYDAFTVAMGCTLLASKIEEKPLILREIVFAFHSLRRSRLKSTLPSIELGSLEYTAWKNELMTMERYILKELGFALYSILDHPHKFLLLYLQVRMLFIGYLLLWHS